MNTTGLLTGFEVLASKCLFISTLLSQIGTLTTRFVTWKGRFLGEKRAYRQIIGKP